LRRVERARALLRRVRDRAAVHRAGRRAGAAARRGRVVLHVIQGIVAREDVRQAGSRRVVGERRGRVDRRARPGAGARAQVVVAGDRARRARRLRGHEARPAAARVGRDGSPARVAAKATSVQPPGTTTQGPAALSPALAPASAPPGFMPVAVVEGDGLGLWEPGTLASSRFVGGAVIASPSPSPAARPWTSSAHAVATSALPASTARNTSESILRE